MKICRLPQDVAYALFDQQCACSDRIDCLHSCGCLKCF